MPPALSDYGDSDSEIDFDSYLSTASPTGDIDVVKSPSVQESPIVKTPIPKTPISKSPAQKRQLKKTTTSKKRKHSNLLAGINLENILPPVPSQEEDASSVAEPTSSYRTRGTASTDSTRRQIQYNQRYHPMDDYIRPSQAAKVRAAYGERAPESDSASEHETFRSEDSSDEENETKRQKVVSQPTRRSSRAVNHDVLYDTNVHPQDAIIDEAMSSSDSAHVSDGEDGVVVPDSEGDIHVSDSEDGIEISDSKHGVEVSDSEDDIEVFDSEDDSGAAEAEVVDSDDNSSSDDDEGTSSPPLPTYVPVNGRLSQPQSSPLSDITDLIHPTLPRQRVPAPRRILGRRTSPIPIYVESAAVQHAALMSMPAPLPYPHNNQENVGSRHSNIMPQTEQDNPLGNVIFQTMEEFEASQARDSHASDLPSMFDGESDPFELPYQRSDRDSVFGSDRDSVFGPDYSPEPLADVTARVQRGGRRVRRSRGPLMPRFY
ncbi:hypothetical protein CC80DRAFT_83811 [Byssothecium circinans]|uniref:Uncharacterized protein n=1 Tax=Byssothecium circinans TaxID=147558 RepID=A0A6A5TVF8_9PLEO|nr:hypothetical protein CC80DRAFT_83811 [Byssothecium circinans]